MQLLSQEKLQNAEDAGASEVRFLLDSQSYSREKIMAPDTGKNDLARMQVTKDVLQKTLPHPYPIPLHWTLGSVQAFISQVYFRRELSLCSTTQSSQMMTGTG